MSPPNSAILWAAFGLYALSLLFALWRLTQGLPYRRWPKLALVLPGFLFHTQYMWERGLAEGRCPVSNLFETLTFIAWCLVALHLVITLTGRMNYVTVFYMPLVLAIQLAALIAPTDQPAFHQWQENSWLGLHASVITLGYAAFGLAGAVALMYLVQESQLRKRRIGSSFMLLPPILRLEAVQGRLIMAGFCLLTIGLLSGFVGLQAMRQGMMTGDAKLLWSLAVWGLYLSLVLGRCFWGISGRRMAWLSLTGCVLVLTTFWLANALSQFHRF